MAETDVHPRRHLVVRARLQLLTLLLTGIVILLVMAAVLHGLEWSAWVIGAVALLLSVAGWVVWGTRPKGWPAACAITWGAHLGAAAAFFMFGEFGAASIAGGVVYGSVWAAALLIPVGLVSAIMQLRPRSQRTA